jgi:hypothetical protein
MTVLSKVHLARATNLGAVRVEGGMMVRTTGKDVATDTRVLSWEDTSHSMVGLWFWPPSSFGSQNLDK